jgi:hypothetical protein
MMKFLRMRPMALALAVLFAPLAACSNVERAKDPITGRLSWFALLEGRDIRQACVPGSPARYRFVYNGPYDVQTRVYDVTRTEAGAAIKVAVTNGSAATVVEYRGAAQNPWQPVRDYGAPVDLDTYRALARALEADGFGQPPRTDVAFPSWNYYWIVSACADGKYHLNGWLNGTPAGKTAFNALTFPAFLQKLDQTEIAFATPRPNPFADYRERHADQTPDQNFEVRLSKNGLALTQPLF